MEHPKWFTCSVHILVWLDTTICEYHQIWCYFLYGEASLNLLYCVLCPLAHDSKSLSIPTSFIFRACPWLQNILPKVPPECNTVVFLASFAFTRTNRRTRTVSRIGLKLWKNLAVRGRTDSGKSFSRAVRVCCWLACDTVAPNPNVIIHHNITLIWAIFCSIW